MSCLCGEFPLGLGNEYRNSKKRNEKRPKSRYLHSTTYLLRDL